MLSGRYLVGVLVLLPALAVCQAPVAPDLPVDFARAQPWHAMDEDRWQYLRRGSSKDDDIVLDASAPFSPPDVLRIVFTPDMGRDQEPSVHWTALENAVDVHAVWWMKLSANWTASPAGGGKIAFLHLAPDGLGQVYINIGGAAPPHEIAINTEWAPYGQHVWTPNRTNTPIVYDQWFRLDWHVSLPTGLRRTATLKWWVNGIPNGDYNAVHVPPGLAGFQQFEFAPTLQNPPPAEQYMFIDHTLLNAN
jgi:hypothetical protein